MKKNQVYKSHYVTLCLCCLFVVHLAVPRYFFLLFAASPVHRFFLSPTFCPCGYSNHSPLIHTACIHLYRQAPSHTNIHLIHPQKCGLTSLFINIYIYISFYKRARQRVPKRSRSAGNLSFFQLRNVPFCMWVCCSCMWVCCTCINGLGEDAKANKA